MKGIILVLMATFLVAAPVLADKKEKQTESYNYKRAMEAYDNEDYDEAMTYLLREVAENEKNGYAHLWMSGIYTAKEEYGRGLSAANNALKYLPAKDKEMVSASYEIRAHIYLGLKDTLKAIDDMDAALRVTPENEAVIELKGDTYWEMERYDESNACYMKLIEMDEASALGHMGYGRNLKEQKMWKEAEEEFALVTRLYSDFSQAFAFLAECQIGMKKWPDAADNIIKALCIDYNPKAFSLMQTEDRNFASVMSAKLKAQMAKDPAEGMWPFSVAAIYENQKQYRRAIEMYKKSYDMESRSGTAERLAACYHSMGMQQKALEYINLAYSLDSTDTDIISSKADLMYYCGDTQGAIAQMGEYVDCSPESNWGYYRRGWYEDNARMVDEAIEDYTMSVTLDSTYYYAYLGRADQYIKKGMREEAMADYRMVTQLDTVPSTSSCAFYAFVALGEREKGLAFLDSCMTRFPDDEGTYYDACCLHARMGEKEKAIGYLKTALEKGFSRFAHIDMDDDIDALREMPEFKALIEEYRGKLEKEIAEENANAETTTPTAANEASTTEIPFTRDSGNTCTVKCSINELPLNFVFDTGASTVSLSQVEATFMMKNGYLKKEDVVGKQYYSDANGNVNEGTVINLKRVNFGGIELSNIKASVVKNQKAPLLLGQSVFQKLGKIEIDNEKKMLRVTRK